MSHKITVSTRLTNMSTLRQVCDRLGHQLKTAAPGKQLSAEVYTTRCKGVAIMRLRDWRFPVVLKQDGTAQYDNFKGNWGEQSTLDQVCQEYAVEETKHVYEDLGMRLESQEAREDGTLVLTMTT